MVHEWCTNGTLVRVSCVDAETCIRAFIVIMFVYARCPDRVAIEDIKKVVVCPEDHREAVKHRYFVQAGFGDKQSGALYDGDKVLSQLVLAKTSMGRVHGEINMANDPNSLAFEAKKLDLLSRVN